MATPPDPAILSILYAAQRSELGIRVATTSATSLRAKCYNARKSDDSLKHLAFVVSPKNPDGELWIIKKPAKEEPNA